MLANSVLDVGSLVQEFPMLDSSIVLLQAAMGREKEDIGVARRD
jgi:hypothetical protein